MNRFRHRPLSRSVFAVAAVFSCGEAPVSNTAAEPQGRESRGTFAFVCGSAGSVVCAANGIANEFPKTIAVGERFTLRYRRNARGEDGPEVRFVSPHLVQSNGTEWVATRAGVSTFYIESLAGELNDEITVRFTEAQ